MYMLSVHKLVYHDSNETQPFIGKHIWRCYCYRTPNRSVWCQDPSDIALRSETDGQEKGRGRSLCGRGDGDSRVC